MGLYDDKVEQWAERNWRAFIEEIAGDSRDTEHYATYGWTLLRSLYGYGYRPYHNIRHAARMVMLFHGARWEQAGRKLRPRDDIPRQPREGTARGVLQSHDLVELAIWFHDCVYDPRSKPTVNERYSAQVASDFVAFLGYGYTAASAVSQQIMDTTHVEPKHSVICDLDLEGLAADRENYIANSRCIRQEYSHLSDAEWWAGRRDFLRKMLARRFIYMSGILPKDKEGAARENMQAELEYVTGKLDEVGDVL